DVRRAWCVGAAGESARMQLRQRGRRTAGPEPPSPSGNPGVPASVSSHAASRPRAVFTQPPRDDPLGVEADAGRFSVERLGPSPDLDPARLPWREHIIDDKRGAAGPCDVPVLLGRREVVAAHLDDLVTRHVRPPHGCDVWRAVRADRGHAGQPPFRRQVVELRVGEHAHRVLRARAGMSVAPTTMWSATSVIAAAVVAAAVTGMPSETSSTADAPTVHTARARRGLMRSSTARAAQPARPAISAVVITSGSETVMVPAPSQRSTVSSTPTAATATTHVTVAATTLARTAAARKRRFGPGRSDAV